MNRQSYPTQQYGPQQQQPPGQMGRTSPLTTGAPGRIPPSQMAGGPPPINTGAPVAGYPPNMNPMAPGQGGPPAYPGGPGGYGAPPPGQQPMGGYRPGGSAVEAENNNRSKAQLIVGIDFVRLYIYTSRIFLFLA